MTERSKRLEEFKTIIRSCLVSAPAGVPLRSLSRYCADLGESIPYRELGYSNEFELLRAIPDTVRLSHHGIDYVAFAVVTDDVAHVAELVRKQKKSNTGYPRVNTRLHHDLQPNRNYNNRRTNIPPRMQPMSIANRMIRNTLNLNMPRCVSAKMKQDINDLLYEYPQGILLDNLKSAYKSKYGLELNHQDFDYVRINDFVRALDSEGILKIQESSNSIVVFHPAVLNQQKLRNVKSSMANVSNRTSNGSKENKTEVNSKTDGQSNNYSLNAKVYDNLVKVLERYPEGFLLTQLCDHYLQVTGTSLEYRELGYNNVQELINNVDDLFNIKVHKDGQWLLTDARRTPEPEETNEAPVGDEERKEIPDYIQQNIYDLLFHNLEGVLLSQFDRVYEMNFEKTIPWKDLNFRSLHEMLMELDFHNPIRFVQCGLSDLKVMLMPREPAANDQCPEAILQNPEPTVPEDAVVFGEPYTQAKIPPADGNYFAVVVSLVETPGRIWLQMVNQEEVKNTELDTLMDELEDFYQSTAANEYKIPNKFLGISMNCAVVYPEDQSWHRGCIVGKPGPTTLEVFFYDYGGVYEVERDLLRLLKKCFAELPAQAFPARLANIEPLSKTFSSEATARLFNLVRSSKPLMAQITSKQYKNNTSIVLCDTSEDDDLFLNDLLWKEKLVKYNHDQQELRSPHLGYNLDGAPSNPDHLYGEPVNGDSVVISSMPNFIAPLGASSSMEYDPANSNPQIFHKRFVEDESMAAPNINFYQPPSLTDSQNNYRAFVPDPNILQRMENNNMVRRRALNLSPKEDQHVPRAAVEPIQVSQMRDKDGRVLVPLSPLNQTDANGVHEIQNHFRQNENVLPSLQDDLYESSKEEEEDEQPEPEITSHFTSVPCSSAITGQVRFCKRVHFREAVYSAHLINFQGKPCFTSADVSSFVFGLDIIKRILHIQKYPPCHILASKEDHPALFDDLEYHKVSGFTADDTEIDKVVLYDLFDVVKILRFLNHDKQILIEDIEELCNNFDGKDVYWITRPYSPEDDELPNDKDMLESRVQEAREERRSLLRTLLDEDVSTPRHIDRLQVLDNLISRIKEKLPKFERPQTKSAAEQAREFLERIKLNQESSSMQGSEPNQENLRTTPIETVTAVPAITSALSRTTEVTIQAAPASALVAANQSMFLPNHNSLGAQAFVSNPVVPVLSNNTFPQVLPFGYAPLRPNNFVYQQVNTTFPGHNLNNIRFQGNYPNW